MPAGYGESLFHRITVGPGEVISLTYAVDPGLPELASELIDLASTDLPRVRPSYRCRAGSRPGRGRAVRRTPRRPWSG